MAKTKDFHFLQILRKQDVIGAEQILIFLTWEYLIWILMQLVRSI